MAKKIKSLEEKTPCRRVRKSPELLRQERLTAYCSNMSQELNKRDYKPGLYDSYAYRFWGS